MDRNFPQWLLALSDEDIAFMKNFVMASGSLKEIATLYNVSYPTVRLRLDKLIQKIELQSNEEQEPFVVFVKNLAIDSKIDIDVAKQIITCYQHEKKELT